MHKNALRPTPRQSEIDIAKDFNGLAREQVSFLNGKEVPHGTLGSVRPDLCIGKICSIEVKNYDLAHNKSNLIRDIVNQATYRELHLPKDMKQTVIIDIRGQSITEKTKQNIIMEIIKKSNGVIMDINFKEK